MSFDGYCSGCLEYEGCLCGKLRAEEEEARYMEGLDDDDPDDDGEDEDES